MFRNGGYRDQIRYDNSSITIYAWAETEQKAFELMAEIREAMFRLPAEVLEVSSCDESLITCNDLIINNRRRYEGLYYILSTI